ncbi:MAG: MotA/TolQ/ExbB proton channel family protein [Akkermansiaceae bacterium]|nr:MotA/TolQ/ExbB proton channel family protein [Akkermansiaceae bacterium]
MLLFSLITDKVLSPGGVQLVELFEKGGALMWPLLALSVIALMVFFICLWTTRSSAVLPMRVIAPVETFIRRKDYAGLMDMCERTDSNFTRTLRVVMLFLQRNPRANIDEVREVASAEGSRQANSLTRQISWLADIGGIAPMIGLLGTVIGMMRTFTEMAAGNFEGVKQMQMASGISEAMITTAGGLVLAIPCMLCYVIFRNRIQKRITDMEAAITHILSVISGQMDRDQRLGNYAQRAITQEVISSPREDDPYN